MPLLQAMPIAEIPVVPRRSICAPARARMSSTSAELAVSIGVRMRIGPSLSLVNSMSAFASISTRTTFASPAVAA